MNEQKKFLVDVGMNDIPFPMKVISRDNKEGQSTIANISINARIMQEFEAKWIDKFIKILHQHRDRIGAATLRENILDYQKELNAATVKIGFSYPFFIEKITPISKEKCLVKYQCFYSAKTSSIDHKPRIFFGIQVPIITTYPASSSEKTSGLFGQLNILNIEVESIIDIYPEQIVDIVDKCALASVYSFLTQEDQMYLIQKIHSEEKSSVVTVDEVKDKLAHITDIEWYSVRCTNMGMLHSYNTVIGTEKSSWVPFSNYSE